MPFTTYESSNEEKYLDYPPIEQKKDIYKCDKVAKKTASYLFATIAASTHAVNSFMAAVTLLNLLDNTEAKTLAEIFTEGTFAASALTLCAASLAGLSSELVNFDQVLDYMPKLKKHLENFKSLKQKPNKQQLMTLGVLGVSVGAAATSAFFAWETYASIQAPWVRLPLSMAASSVSFCMTLSSRFVKMKKFVEENWLITSPEDKYLLNLTRKLQHYDAYIPLGLPHTSIENPKLAAVVHHFMIALQQRRINYHNKDNLELIFSHMMRSEESAFNKYANQIYTWLSTSLIAEVYSERLAAIIPRTKGYIAIPWDFIRLGLSAAFSSPHIITYYMSAQEIQTSLKASFLISKVKTISYLLINIGAAFSLVNYYLTVANMENPNTTLPLPNQNSALGRVACILALLTAINQNFLSCADLHILPPPSKLARKMIEMRDEIIDQKPVLQRKIYTQNVRQVQSLLFKPPVKPRHEQAGCLTRIRMRLGWQ